MADNGHKRDTDARTPTPLSEGRTPRRPSRAALVAAPIALVATAATVAVGVVSSDAGPASSPTAQESVVDVTDRVAARPAPVSRGGSRIAAAQRRTLQEAFDRNARWVARANAREAREAAARATRAAVADAHVHRWTTAPLNLWTLPGEEAEEVGLLAEEKKVLVTGRQQQGREEVVVGGRSRWVTAGYLADEKPVEEVAPAESTGESDEGSAAPREASTGECTNGTSVSPGVSPNVVAVHRATCAAFPSITSYGDFRGDGEHAQGIALDIMVSGDLGWQVAEYLRANHADLGISYLIYSQRIWSVERSSEGWRGMEDRGSTTANHYDHVHVTTY